jgi:2-iminobutanoate/2-iminopropanoate deaminase
MVYTAGQIGLDPATMEIVSGGVEAETRQVLNNLRQVLEAANSGLNYVVKTTVFLRDMADFPKMNAVYAEFFAENPPARSTVAVAGLPKGVAVEIEAVALVSPDHGD